MFQDKVPYIPNWPPTCCVAEDNLELKILLPLSPSAGITDMGYYV